MKTEYELRDYREVPIILLGIYAISSKYDNKNYVGKTCGAEGFRGRWESHYNQLKGNRHPNPFLQKSFNKHGEDMFKFRLLEICDENDDFIKKESDWIKKLKSTCAQIGWNMVYDSDDSLNARTSQSRRYQVIDPNGEIHTFIGIKKFAIKNNLNYAHFWEMLNYKAKSCQGWTTKSQIATKPIYKLINPFGQLVEFSNIKQFAVNNKLHDRTIGALIKGNIGYYNGWTSPEHREKFKQNNIIGFYRRDKEIKVFSYKDCLFYIFKDYVKFAEKHNIVPRVFLKMINEKYNVLESGGFCLEKNIKIIKIINIETKTIFVAKTARAMAKKTGLNVKTILRLVNNHKYLAKKLHSFELYTGDLEFSEVREDF
jgi:group I intron endonuclease